MTPRRNSSPEVAGRPISLELAQILAGFAAEHRLSPRETALLQTAVAGMSSEEAAAALRCTRPTIGTYWNRIFAKVGKRSQRDVICSLLVYALAGGVVRK